MTHSMKRFLPVCGAVLVIIGTVWFLQGINVLPDSFMTGQTRWAWIGGGCFIVGVIFLVLPK